MGFSLTLVSGSSKKHIETKTLAKMPYILKRRSITYSDFFPGEKEGEGSCFLGELFFYRFV